MAVMTARKFKKEFIDELEKAGINTGKIDDEEIAKIFIAARVFKIWENENEKRSRKRQRV